MAKLLKGKLVAERLSNACAERIRALLEKGVQPRLAIVRIGNNPGDKWYANAATRKLAAAGVDSSVIELKESIPQDLIVQTLNNLSADDAVTGILLMRPLPSHLDKEIVENAIAPEKDIDGMCDVSLAKVFRSDPKASLPCTVKAVLHLLDFYHIELEGTRVVVVGRSLTIGKPLAQALVGRNATVTLAHSKTLNLSHLTREADIVVSCMGRAHALTDEYFSDKSLVIDVGTNEDADGKMVGDVDFDAVEPLVQAITPVPGGVGAVTTASLLEAVVSAAEYHTIEKA